nr:hypothetical protein [Pseudomonadales bacterium]
AFKNQAMLAAIVGVLVEFEQKHKHLPVAEQEAMTNAIGSQLVSVEPAREDPDINRSVLCCYGRGNTESVSVVMRGNSPYIQTGIVAAEACRQILLGKHRGAGFSSPCAAFGAREMIAANAARGQLSWTVTAV